MHTYSPVLLLVLSVCQIGVATPVAPTAADDSNSPATDMSCPPGICATLQAVGQTHSAQFSICCPESGADPSEGSTSPNTDGPSGFENGGVNTKAGPSLDESLGQASPGDSLTSVDAQASPHDGQHPAGASVKLAGSTLLDTGHGDPDAGANVDLSTPYLLGHPPSFLSFSNPDDDSEDNGTPAQSPNSGSSPDNGGGNTGDGGTGAGTGTGGGNSPTDSGSQGNSDSNVGNSGTPGSSSGGDASNTGSSSSPQSASPSNQDPGSASTSPANGGDKGPAPPVALSSNGSGFDQGTSDASTSSTDPTESSQDSEDDDEGPIVLSLGRPGFDALTCQCQYA